MPRRVLPAYARPDERFVVDDLGAVHFIGIGGAGMSGIARLMLEHGVAVSGSDAKESAVLRGLREAGASVQVGHGAGALGDADTVVVSSAIKATNPELAEALYRGLRVMPRAQALAAVMAGRTPVAVAGTHGKTSTTSMLVAALEACGADPSYAVGADLSSSGRNAHLGGGALFAVEADESDGSFLLLHPHLAIVTNIEADHLDNYGDLESVLAAFDALVDTIDEAGALVACADDVHAMALAQAARARGRRAITYGTDPTADLRLEEVVVDAGGTSYLASGLGLDHLAVHLAVPGLHMARNSAAVLAACALLGLDAQDAARGLAGYGGVQRRMERVGESHGVRVFDDYAHHPTEVAAQLVAARAVAGEGRLIACFQPHLYSRTQSFAAEFAAALSLADEVVVMDVYPAREDAADFPGVTGDSIASLVSPPVRFVAERTAVAPELASRAETGDLVITLGAGDVTEIGPLVLEALERPEGLRGRDA